MLRHYVIASLLTAATGSLAQSADPTRPADKPAAATSEAQPTFVIAKWKARLYGFVELDVFGDDAQGFPETVGHTVIPKPGTVAGDNARLQFSMRNTRVGFNLESPDFSGVKAFANLETDFAGFEPNPFGPTFCTAVGGNGGSVTCTATSAGNSTRTEDAFFSAPTWRLRHAYLKVTTPWVDVLAGQYWQLFGGSGAFTPATVALQAIVGEVYQRTPQLRLSRTFALASKARLELAAAALRPYQRESAMPDLSGLVRFEYDGWRGFKGAGGTGSGTSGLQVALSAYSAGYRAIRAPAASTSDFDTARGTAFALDVIVPIIPVDPKGSKAGALTFVGEGTTGSGYSGVFGSLTAGTQLGAPTGATNYSTTIDPGPVGYDPTRGGEFRTISYRSLLTNLQYVLPFADGNVLSTFVFSTTSSDDAWRFTGGKPGNAMVDVKYFSGGLSWDFTPATRLGLELSHFRQRMGDQSVRSMNRAHCALYFIY